MSLSQKGEKDVEKDLLNICNAEGLTDRVLISLSFTGLCYAVEDVASKIYLNGGCINSFNRTKLKILEICGKSHTTMFELMDRFNKTDDINEKMKHAQAHQRELVIISLKLEEFFKFPITSVKNFKERSCTSIMYQC